ncbi:MAG: hypothetical protein R3F62_26790 [Planctomycetota bacterium]
MTTPDPSSPNDQPRRWRRWLLVALGAGALFAAVVWVLSRDRYWPSADAECVLYAYQHGFDPNAVPPDLAQLAQRGLLPSHLADGRHEGWCFRGGVHAPNLELARELGYEPTWQAWVYVWPEEPRAGETRAIYRQYGGYPWASNGPTAAPPLPHETSNPVGWDVIDHPARLRKGPFWAEHKPPPK